DDLRLEPAEGRALVARLAPSLTTAHADALVARVEGWPAGVQLAARSLRGKADPADVIERFTGTDRYVLAFLTEEVLLRLPDDLHEAAVLLAGQPRLCAGLVEAVTGRGDGAALLARLEAAEAFLERLDAIDDDGPWFRFPDFFRDLLAYRLRLTHPDLPSRLEARAADWWASRGRRATERDGDGGPLADERGGGDPPGEALTEREREVAALLAAGASNKAIARALGVSPNTVKTHTRHVFEKLGARNRTEAAAAARRRGLV
ncbi:MAG: helix-turn-helix domain-containing protein, partial [Nocardiopsis sp. BM-2018]